MTGVQTCALPIFSSSWSNNQPALDSSYPKLWYRQKIVWIDGEVTYSPASTGILATVVNDLMYFRNSVAGSGYTTINGSAVDVITKDANDGVKVHNSSAKADNYSHIKSDGLHVYVAGQETSFFGANKVELGKNSATSSVGMCANKAGVQARYGSLLDVYSNNAEYDTTLDFDINEATFKAKVGTYYDFYEFVYNQESGWELLENSYQPSSGPVTMSQFGIVVHTTQLNDYAGIQISYYSGSHVKLFNTDTATGSRKLELELAEGLSTENTDYANICIERQTQEYESGDINEHSIINMMTVHDSANCASFQISNGEKIGRAHV